MPIEKLRPTYTFTQDRLDALQQLVPEAFVDGQINWDTLKEVLGEHLEDEGEEAEHFGLFWPGKRQARRLASIPSEGTLVPAPGEGVDEDTTRHIFIEGDNREVLKLLQKSYAGRVKMIYIDPPYNTGNDFIYQDNFTEPLQDYMRLTGQTDEAGVVLTTNPKTSGRYHSNWLSMMYPRLLLARDLLTEDGVILVSIDDNEVHNLCLLMNEAFGQENFMAQFVWKSRQFPDARAVTRVSTDHEYILAYSSRNDSSFRGIERDESKFRNPDDDPRGLWMSRSLLGLATIEQRPNLHYVVLDPETRLSYQPPPNTGWRYSKERMAELIADGRILFPAKPEGRPREKKFRKDLKDEFIPFPSIIADVFTAQGTAEIRDLFGFQAYDFPKPSELIRRLVEQLTMDSDHILDYFAGSCSTAQAVSAQNRKDGGARSFICVQLPESVPDESEAARKGLSTIAEIGKERIRRVIANMQQDTDGQLDLNTRDTPEDLGFKVFKLARSNFKHWQDYEGEDIQGLQMHLDQAETPLVDGWKPPDLLTQILLTEGFPLDSRVAVQEGFAHNQVHLVTSDFHQHRLFVCLDPSIAAATIAQLDLQDQDIIVCLDAALSDEAKLRLSDSGNLHVI